MPTYDYITELALPSSPSLPNKSVRVILKDLITKLHIPYTFHISYQLYLKVNIYLDIKGTKEILKQKEHLILIILKLI